MHCTSSSWFFVVDDEGRRWVYSQLLLFACFIWFRVCDATFGFWCLASRDMQQERARAGIALCKMTKIRRNVWMWKPHWDSDFLFFCCQALCMPISVWLVGSCVSNASRIIFRRHVAMQYLTTTTTKCNETNSFAKGEKTIYAFGVWIARAHQSHRELPAISKSVWGNIVLRLLDYMAIARCSCAIDTTNDDAMLLDAWRSLLCTTFWPTSALHKFLPLFRQPKLTGWARNIWNEWCPSTPSPSHRPIWSGRNYYAELY